MVISGKSKPEITALPSKKNAYQNQWEIYAMLPNGPCMEYPTFEQFVGQFNLQYSISGAFGAVQCRFHPIGM